MQKECPDCNRTDWVGFSHIRDGEAHFKCGNCYCGWSEPLERLLERLVTSGAALADAVNQVQMRRTGMTPRTVQYEREKVEIAALHAFLPILAEAKTVLGVQSPPAD